MSVLPEGSLEKFVFVHKCQSCQKESQKILLCSQVSVLPEENPEKFSVCTSVTTGRTAVVADILKTTGINPALKESRGVVAEVELAMTVNPSGLTYLEVCLFSEF